MLYLKNGKYLYLPYITDILKIYCLTGRLDDHYFLWEFGHIKFFQLKHLKNTTNKT